MTLDLPGFADPVRDAQSCFRAVLQAMSRPGSVHAAGHGLTPPPGLDPATAATLLTLVDAETRLFVDDRFTAAQDWIAFHCGATPCAAPAAASFLLCAELPDLPGLNTGSDEAPEDSATIILQILALDAGTPFTLTGPGLQRPATTRVHGLPADFVATWQANHALYPRGVDVILCAGTKLTALPRSVRFVAG